MLDATKAETTRVGEAVPDATLPELAVSLRSPLQGLQLPDVPDVATLRDPGPLTRFVVRGDDAAVAGLGAWLGVVPPAQINRAAANGDRIAMKLGPDEWLVLAEPAAGRELGAPASDKLVLVDVSHRNAGLVLCGPQVEAVLAAGCPLPLNDQAFPAGRATRTLFAKAEIVLWRQSATTFHIEVARSFAPYLVAHLAEAIDVEAALAGLSA